MSDSRTRVWFALFVLAIFVLGLATGIVMGRRMGQPSRQGGPPIVGFGRGGGPGGTQSPGRLIERLERDLQLTAEQRTQLEAVFQARRPQVEAMQKEMVARAEQEQRDLRAEIRKVLTPEQQQRFDRWLEAAPRGRGGRGRGGPR